MAVSVTCASCGRRDVLTVDERPAWLPTAEGPVCPSCASYELQRAREGDDDEPHESEDAL